MKKDLRWPVGIIIVMVAFIAMTLGFVKIAFSQRVDLVAKDYYYRDKEFSGRLTREKNLLSKGEAGVTRTTTGIEISLPGFFSGKTIEGTVFFYSPLNPADDFQLPVKFTGNRGSISANLKPGQKWKVTVDFTAAGDKYFFEKAVW